MVAKVEHLMAEPSPSPASLAQLRLSLNKKLELLDRLDDEYLSKIPENDVADEIASSDEFKEGLYAAIVNIDRALTVPATPVPVVSTASPAPTAGPKVKLPKLTLKSFDGDITAWTPFWDSFKAGVHDNPSLSDVDKFNYLRGLLQRTALDSISGLSLTSLNYREAVSILEKRFGNKPQIVSKHMDLLINLDAVNSSQNLKGLRRLYDTIESNVRSLKSLGVASDTYGTLLASVLFNKIPQEIQLIVSRKCGSSDWKLDELMTTLSEELEARERTTTVAGSTPAKKPTKETHTAAALFTSTNKITCSYCRQDHSSNSCGFVAQPQARREVLQRSGRCFVCLRRGHLSRDCGSRNKCFKCSGRHHVSICMKGDNPTSTGGSDQTGTGNTPAVQTRPPPSDMPAAPRSGLNAAAPTFQGQGQRSTSLYVNSHRSILLQTAQAQAFNPKSPRRSLGVRILFDSGSQRSYITQRVAGELSLQSEGTQRMTILTFGSTQERSQHCSCVRLNFELRNGQTKQLLLYTVPRICEALSTHPIPPSHGQLDHLKGLHLADCSSGSSELEIDILVGSDQY